MTFFLLFNHRLSPEQEADARKSLDVNNFTYLPDDLQALWSQVPPEPETLHAHVAPVLHWLDTHAQAGDVVMVQGDYGVTWIAVNHCLSKGYLPVYGTTGRQTVETPQPDGSVKIERVFRHVRFRRYGQ
ncbi:MAG: CRISPR-associated protein Csx20 [Bacteroidia bacterium]|nr:CRISPR-associated protein Csx20 [Bacteroidia bacterium]